MSWVGVGMGVASIGAGLYSANQGSEAQKKAGAVKNRAANLEADVLEQQASNAIGAAQRDAFDLQRESRLAQSRAIALSAASGGGASTAPTVVKLVSNLAKEGSYNSARALYAGMESARLKRLQATELRTMGEFAVVGSNIAAEAEQAKGAASALNTGTSLYAKYRDSSRSTPNPGYTPSGYSSAGNGDLPVGDFGGGPTYG